VPRSTNDPSPSRGPSLTRKVRTPPSNPQRYWSQMTSPDITAMIRKETALRDKVIREANIHVN